MQPESHRTGKKKKETRKPSGALHTPSSASITPLILAVDQIKAPSLRNRRPGCFCTACLGSGDKLGLPTPERSRLERTSTVIWRQARSLHILDRLTVVCGQRKRGENAQRSTGNCRNWLASLAKDRPVSSSITQRQVSQTAAYRQSLLLLARRSSSQVGPSAFHVTMEFRVHHDRRMEHQDMHPSFSPLSSGFFKRAREIEIPDHRCPMRAVWHDLARAADHPAVLLWVAPGE